MIADEKSPLRNKLLRIGREYEKNQLHHRYGNIASVYNRRVQLAGRHEKTFGYCQ